MNAATKPPVVKLVIECIECGEVAHAPFDNNELSPKRLFHQIGWILSIVDPDPKGIVLAPVCGPCAHKIYPPEMFAKVTKALE